MSDHGSAGRMVALVPITWDHGFPLIGLPGNLRKAPNTWVKPNTGFTQAPKPAFVHDDSFNGTLNPEWQWNHVPDDSKWSLTEKPGVLRLHSLAADNFYNARNSITQRPPAPESIMTVELDTSGLAAGDIAGLGLVSTPYAWIGVSKTAEGTTLLMGTGAAAGTPRRHGHSSGVDARHRRGHSTGASLAARALQLRHGPGRLQLERRRQSVHAARQSLHDDLPVDDVPGRAPGAVQFQHLRARPAAMPTSTTTRSRSPGPAASSARFRSARSSRSRAGPTAACWPATPGATCSSALRRTARRDSSERQIPGDRSRSRTRRLEGQQWQIRLGGRRSGRS